MAIQSSFYTPDGSTRTFPSTKHIASKQHMAVWFRRLADSVWVVQDVASYELINNTAVLQEAPSVALYDNIEIRVADTQDELINSPTDIAIVASVADDLAAVVPLADDLALVGAVASDIPTVAGDTVAINDITTDPLRTSVLNAGANATAAATSAAEAAASAASIDPTNLLHTVGTGAGNPEGYTAAETYAKTETYSQTEVDEFSQRWDYQTITHDFTIDADYTLTATQNLYGRIILTDTGVLLTTSRNVIVDNTERVYFVQNDTAQTLIIKTSAGTGISLVSGMKATLRCDGTNIVNNDIPSYEYGEWSPTVIVSSNVINVGYSGTGKYIRIGNTVYCSVIALPTVTSTNTFSRFYIDIPIASDILALSSLVGNGTYIESGTGHSSAKVVGDATNDRAEVTFYSISTLLHSFAINFTYQIN